MNYDEEIVKIETIEEDRQFKLYFLGELYCTYYSSKKSALEEAQKRQRAYDLIPNGCKIIPRNKIKQFEGKLVGGIMADSIHRVFGIANIVSGS